MKASILFCAAVAALFGGSVECIQTAPKWVEDMKHAYKNDLKAAAFPVTVLAPEGTQATEEVSPQVDMAALTAELARLEENEESFRGDRRTIAFMATMIMVGVFLMFFFTTVRVEQAIKTASKLTGIQSSQPVDQRL